MKNIDRRKFIGKTALAGLGIAGAGAILSSCKREPDNKELGLPPILRGAPKGKKLRAALIGCGARGTGAAINFISSGPDLEIVALADTFQDQIDACRERFASFNLPIPEENCFAGFEGYKKAMAIPDIDVVLLCTPPRFRPDHFLEAVNTNKHVFMEKPSAVDPVGIRSIITSARKATSLGLNVVTGTQRRHQEDYIATYKKIKQGAIGTITSAKAFWNQDHVWFRLREPGWDDMEYMIRNWNNFCWLCGDHILDTHVHNIDVINWFIGKYPEKAIGYGGRARRVTGDQYDFFSIDFDYGNGVYSHSMCRQIDSCANGTGEVIMGTKGYTNCQNTIWDLDGNVIWQFEYPKDEFGNPMNQTEIPRMFRNTCIWCMLSEPVIM
jgi:myo-inositol 2-dehydrogenase/D-chiro-inositol 1-dehydrogenase